MKPIQFTRSVIVTIAITAALPGCGPSSSDSGNTEAPPPPPDPAIEAARQARQDSLDAKTYAFDCEKNMSFTVRVGKNQAWLHLEDRTVAMPQVAAASGARFKSGDITFWSQGNEARLEIGPDVYENCRQSTERTVWEDARLRGVTFRATGNEPGWYLEVFGRRELLLVIDSGGTAYRLQDVDMLTEGNALTTYIVRSGTNTVTVKVTPGPCQDTMSGTEFERTVTVQLNDEEYSGCGRVLEPAR